jgi:hypothetical protein
MKGKVSHGGLKRTEEEEGNGVAGTRKNSTPVILSLSKDQFSR